MKSFPKQMPMNRTIVGRTIIASVALTAMGLVAAAPASAHTNNLYTVVGNSAEAGLGYSTMGKADGIVAVLPESVDLDVKLFGIEVVNEKGYALGYDGDNHFVSEWNHVTGAEVTKMTAYVDGVRAEIDSFAGLDTLNNGTLVTIVHYYVGDDGSYVIASVNPGTGVLTPLVDITDTVDNEEFYFEAISLATDPATGLTYIFLATMSPYSYFLPVDVAANQIGTITQFEGEGFDNGFFEGADFDPADGSLYFIYFAFLEEGEGESFIEEQLSRLGPPSTWVSATRQIISEAPANSETYRLSSQNLTVEHTALAATGSELPIAAIVILGSVAVIAGGVTVVVARRRSAAATV